MLGVTAGLGIRSGGECLYRLMQAQGAVLSYSGLFWKIFHDCSKSVQFSLLSHENLLF